VLHRFGVCGGEMWERVVPAPLTLIIQMTTTTTTTTRRVAEQFIRTFHNGNYDAEFDDALSFDRSVTIPARPTQASYIKPDNWVERNQIGLEKIRDQLQNYIDKVPLVHSFNLELEHNVHDTLMDNEEPIVWHEPIFDEYWDRLEAKMNQLEIGIDIKCISIENVEMKKERLAALVAMFVSGRVTNSSTDIVFTNANVCGEGIVCLSKLVDVCYKLREFYLLHNPIDNMESARCLSRSLKSHARIHELHLAHCDLGSSLEILSVILQSDVKYINLEHNNIDSLGAVTIAEYLESDPPICQIDLDNNRLNDNDAILISQALKRNTNLRYLNLVGNKFTPIGVKALLSCIFDNSSLNAISESNHTLTRIHMFRNLPHRNFFLAGCIDRIFELDQTQKIVLALQDKDSLLQYFANVPVGLMPDVMAFPRGWVANNEHQHKKLNVLYSTMRWWNMPLLYSYHNCVKSAAKRKRNH
jgi:hypothetical protein